jgi:hypothetical protein
MVDTTGWSVRNKANPYFAKANHVKLAKNQATKRFLDSVVDQFLVVRALLFSDDEPGFFYDFDDWSTLFQDTAGAQPVTAANQGVALALDKRLGLKLGPELVTNGTFETDLSGWFIGANVTAVQDNGEALVTFAGTLAQTNNNWFSQLVFPTDDTKSYQIEFDATWVSGGSLEVGTGFNVRRTIAPSTQKTRYKIIARRGEIGGDAFRNNFTFGASSGTVWRIDNVTVRELKGNHATQATTAARPLTVIHPDGGVRNLVDRSEELTTSPWSSANQTTVTSSGDAWKVVADSGTTGRLNHIYTRDNSGQTETISITAKADDARYVNLGRAGAGVWFDLQDGAVLFSFAGFTGTISAPDDDGYRRVSVEYIEEFANGTSTQVRIYPSVNAPASAGATSGGGNDGVKGILVKNAQRERGTLTPYQKRVNFLDVTEAGKRSIRRLYFNGTSHFLQTSTITPNTDKAQVFAGVRKLSDAARGIIYEHGTGAAGAGGNFVTLNVNRLENNGPVFSVSSTLSAQANASALPNPAPISLVLSGIADNAAPLTLLRKNGNQEDANTVTSVGGDFSANIAAIGARVLGGENHFLNGYIDQLITRFGTNLATGAIETTEKYVSTKVPELVAASEVTWNASTDTYTQNLVGLGR